MSAPQDSMSSSSSLNTGSARKRPWPRHAERSAALNLSLETSTANKRQKTLSSSASTDNNTTFTQSLPTPPKTATAAKGSNTNNTIRLKLEIPKSEISKEDKRTVKIRQAAAERWVPKLRNPFPNNREIKEAYQCKLLRHYTTPTPTGDQQAPAPEPAELIKPQINRSARVDKLLKQFPLLSTPSSNNQISTMTSDQDVELDYQRNVLAYNKAVISSEKAQKLAWKAFSKREKGWIRSVREDMVVSGLPEEDLEREEWRLPNRLPEWCKAKTGKFAREK